MKRTWLHRLRAALASHVAPWECIVVKTGGDKAALARAFLEAAGDLLADPAVRTVFLTEEQVVKDNPKGPLLH